MGLTPQQTIILAIVAMGGLAILALVAVLLFRGSPAPAAPGLATLTPATGSVLPSAAPAQASQIPYRLPAGCAPSMASAVQGKVTRVIDSSTLEVQVDGKAQAVGYAGIAVSPLARPEILTPSLLAGKPVILVKDAADQDTAGRALRYVFAGDQFLNLELVLEGAATVLTSSPHHACQDLFEQAQQQARSEHAGVWKLTPVPTQTFMPLVSLAPSTQVAGCDCASRPTCDEFKTHAAAQACYNACQDYNTRLDDNHNGIACENLP